MNIAVLIVVLLYEFVSILGIGMFINRRNKKKGVEEAGGFAFAGGGLPASLVGITLALTLLGSAHNWGTCANAFDMGVIAVWFGIACAVMMVVITNVTGPWIRRSGAKTVGEFLGHIFGKKAGIMTSAINAALGIAMTCLEVETIAITLSMLTGLNYFVCAVIGGILAMLYVVLAGMKEIAWLNLINAILMYVALIAVFICLCVNLPGGWDAVQQTVEAQQETAWMTSIFGNSALIIGFAIPAALGASLFHGMAQTGYQPIATAKSNKEVKKSIWYAGTINGCFCILPALIGIAAFSIIAYREAGPMMMSPMMIIELCPKPVVALLAMGFLGVDLSSFAVMALAPATIISHDMYTLYKPKATEAQKTKLSRILIFVIGVVSILICNFQPLPTPMVNWIFSFGIPVFVMAVIGIWWKRSEMATVITFVVTWIAVCIWSTFGLQDALGLANFHVNYISLIFSLILGVILTAVLPGKKGLYVDIKKKKA
ncbi:MAG: sodium:solute symporter family protein [Eubacterium sp.]|nr:sodium:solute symporter family protein [Eubacterium sp.]